MSALHQAVNELRDHSIEHAINPFESGAPTREFFREFEHEGLLFKTCFTRIRIPPNHSWSSALANGRQMFLLSVVKLSAVPDARGALMPTEEEGAEIAKAFFPRGCQALTDDLDILRNSRKYLALL